MRKQISRRQFVTLSTVAVAGVITSCGSPAAPPAEPAAMSAPAAPVGATAPAATAPAAAAGAASAYTEAPVLAKLVAEGKLPPVSERLPKNPWVVPVNEGPGKYGGAFHGGYRGTSEENIGWFMQEDLLFYDKDLTLKPDICESFEVNADATEFTFKLREGMKWSDGQPLTAQDYAWFHEHYATDEDLSPGGMSEYKTFGPAGESELATCEAPDDYTVKYTFARPKALFLYSVARFKSATLPSSVLPRHYMAQFHIRTTEDKAKTEAMVKEAKLENWNALFLNKANCYLNPDLPTLSAWQPAVPMPEPIFVLRRNPYFHGVDESGQQLPYLDEHQYRYYDQADTNKLWLLNGELDLEPIDDLETAALMKEREAQTGMTFLRWAETTIYAVSLNHSTTNERLRDLYSKRDFRLALMHALDRDEMNKVVFDGGGKPMQASPIPGSALHNAEASFSNIEYQPDVANQLLDSLGLTERNADGYRVWPDDNSKAVGFVILQTESPTDVKMQELAIEYWKAVGLQVTLNIVQRTQYFADTQTNNCEAGGWSLGRTYTIWNDPGEFIGTTLDKPIWPGWVLWRENPEDPNAVEPPKDHFVRELWDIWGKCELEGDVAKRQQLFQDFLVVWTREVPTIGILNAPASWIAKKQTLRGLPSEAVLNWSTGFLAQYMAEQYWWEDPENHA